MHRRPRTRTLDSSFLGTAEPHLLSPFVMSLLNFLSCVLCVMCCFWVCPLLCLIHLELPTDIFFYRPTIIGHTQLGYTNMNMIATSFFHLLLSHIVLSAVPCTMPDSFKLYLFVISHCCILLGHILEHYKYECKCKDHFLIQPFRDG